MGNITELILILVCVVMFIMSPIIFIIGLIMVWSLFSAYLVIAKLLNKKDKN